MKTFEIFFEDLTPDAQKRLLEAAGLTQEYEANWDVFSLATIDILEEGEGEGILDTDPDFYRGM